MAKEKRIKIFVIKHDEEVKEFEKRVNKEIKKLDIEQVSMGKTGITVLYKVNG